MTAQDFLFSVLASLADIRTALWSLTAVVGTVPAAILTHAMITRKRRK